MNEYTFSYGREKNVVKLPHGLNTSLLAGQPMVPLPNPVNRLRYGLIDPFGCAPLKYQAEGKRNCIVVVSDYTRYVGYEIWLAELLNQLNANGMPDKNIKLYVASGTHRAMTPEEKLESYGREVCDRVTVLDHDCDAMDRMKKVGRTDYGTTIYVDERVYNTEMLLITGGIQFHYFAGYSGGRKALLPGCCARESILHNHKLALDQQTGMFAGKVKAGVAVGNPVNEDMLQVANHLRPDMCINVVVNGDKQIVWLGVGDHGYKLRRGAQFLDKHRMVPVAAPADIAIIGAGGHPKDLTLFQAHKSLRNSVAALKPGAKVFWLAQCEQGEGVEDFQSYRGLSLEECVSRVQREISLYSFCALSLKMLLREYDVSLISTLPDDVAREWGFKPYRDVHTALARELPDDYAGRQWVVIPDCSNLLPVEPENDTREEMEQ